MLMLGTMLEMKAADVYLLTTQTINGIVGKYEVPRTISLLRTLQAAMCIPLKSLPCPKRDSGSVSECQGGVIRCSLQSMMIC